MLLGEVGRLELLRAEHLVLRAVAHVDARHIAEIKRARTRCRHRSPRTNPNLR